MENLEGSDIVWGGEEIAKIIGRSRRVTYQLLEQGLIPAKRIKGRWVASKSKLIAFFLEDAA